MNKWEQQFKDHPVHQSVATVKQKIQELRKRSDIEQFSDALQRLTAVISYLEAHLKIARGEVVATPVMDSIGNSLTGALNEINAFLSNNNIAHINNNLTQHLDSILRETALLPGYPSKKPSEELGNAASEYKETVDALIRALAESNMNLKAKTQEIEKAVGEVQDKITQQKSQIDAQNARMDSVISAHQDQFSKAQETRNTEYNAQLTLLRKETTDLESDLRAKYDALIKRLEQDEQAKSKAIDEQTHGIVENMLKRQEEAAHLVGLIGTTVTTGHYRRRAIMEGISATFFRFVALGLFGGMVYSVWRIAYLAAQDGLDWKIVLFRMVAAALLLVPASYAAAQSANHRRVELSNRKRELELAAIDPYIEKMADEEKSKIKKELVAHFFGDEKEPEQEKDKPVRMRDFMKLMNKLIETVEKFTGNK